MGNQQIDEKVIKAKIESCVDPYIKGFIQTKHSTETAYAKKIKDVCQRKQITLEHLQRFSSHANNKGNLFQKLAELTYYPTK